MARLTGLTGAAGIGGQTGRDRRKNYYLIEVMRFGESASD